MFDLIVIMPFILSDIDYESKLKRFKAVTLLHYVPGEFDWPTWQLKDAWNYDPLFFFEHPGRWPYGWVVPAQFFVSLSGRASRFRVWSSVFLFYFIFLDCDQDRDTERKPNRPGISTAKQSLDERLAAWVLVLPLSPVPWMSIINSSFFFGPWKIKVNSIAFSQGSWGSR